MDKIRYVIAGMLGLGIVMSLMSGIIGAVPANYFNSVTLLEVRSDKLLVRIKPNGTGMHRYFISVSQHHGIACRRLFVKTIHSPGEFEEDLIQYIKPACRVLLNQKGTHLLVGVSTLVQGIEKIDSHHFVMDGPGVFDERMK
jgi:hypothetical protein